MVERPKDDGSYTGDGMELLDNWVLLNDAKEFSEAREGLPRLKRTRGAFYRSLDAAIESIQKSQRMPK